MSLLLVDVATQYAKDKNLKKSEVKKFMNWVNQQPHLPQIDELQAIFFLHAYHYNENTAKKAIDVHFTLKSSHSDIFKMRNPQVSPIKEALDVNLYSVLPKTTPEGYTIILCKLLDVNPKNFDMVTQAKIFDMICSLHLHQCGTSEGYVTLLDVKGAVFRHLFCIKPLVLKTFLRYVEEAIPVRLKGFHFFNTVPFLMNKLLALVKPLMSKELYDLIYVHNTLDDLFKFVPLECLPEDYGGSAPSVSVLHEKSKQKLCENVEFFKWEDKQTVDESKRPGRRNNWLNWH